MNFETHDNVTGLPYYDDFMEMTRQELSAHWGEHTYAFISMDINNFKYINRIYGHVKANELLCNSIDLLLQSEEMVIAACRTHSDHVILLAKAAEDADDIRVHVERISKEFTRRYARQFSSVTLHLNIGIYYIEDVEEDLSFALDKANVARRVAKGNYSIDCVIFQPEMLKRKDEDVKVLAMFESALKNEHIEVYFQPKVNVITQKICGAEALSRLLDENGKTIYPDSYIPVLENSGKIVDLDWYVIRHVFAKMEDWNKKGYSLFPVSINLSRMHFFEEDMAERIIHEFELYEIPTCFIEFELTESLFFAETERIKGEIEKLRAYGFKISMDDFGVGYSTLSALASLPVDIIKFDKSFVHSSMSSEEGFKILQSLIQVFNCINYEVICEGVETKSEEKQIFECGCDCVQGFLYDKPIRQEEFVEKYLKK